MPKMEMETSEGGPLELYEPTGERSGVVRDIPDELFQRYNLAKEAWMQVQEELERILYGGF